jgi:hypothetical protein
MESEILAIAVIRPFEGREADVLNLLSNFYVMLSRKGYCRDVLYRSEVDAERLINLRYWTSDETRREASEDPEVHRYWQELVTMAEVEKVYQRLYPLELTQTASR